MFPKVDRARLCEFDSPSSVFDARITSDAATSGHALYALFVLRSALTIRKNRKRRIGGDLPEAASAFIYLARMHSPTRKYSREMHKIYLVSPIYTYI